MLLTAPALQLLASSPKPIEIGSTRHNGEQQRERAAVSVLRKSN
jgi:hypothetical protein